MRYKSNWEQAKKNYLAFWAHENDQRPLLNLRVTEPYETAARPQNRDALRAWWLDSERIIHNAKEWVSHTYFAAESVPCVNPNFGPDVFGASYGTDIVFEESTSYSVPFVRDWSTQEKLVLRDDNPWWRAMRAFTKAVHDASDGDYLTGITDIHAGMDGLVSIRGPENLCMDMIDCPQEVSKRAFELHDGFRTYMTKLHEITSGQDGCTNWMGAWHPEMWYVTSCDFCCMISEEMFRTYILPEIVEETKFLGSRTIFHLDGPNALRHLDALLEVPTISGIQWVFGAGQPSASHWIPVLQKIQRAGKGIHLSIEPWEYDVIMEHISPKGVLFNVLADFTRDEADAFVRHCERTR